MCNIFWSWRCLWRGWYGRTSVFSGAPTRMVGLICGHHSLAVLGWRTTKSESRWKSKFSSFTLEHRITMLILRSASCLYLDKCPPRALSPPSSVLLESSTTLWRLLWNACSYLSWHLILFCILYGHPVRACHFFLTLGILMKWNVRLSFCNENIDYIRGRQEREILNIYVIFNLLVPISPRVY